VSVFSSSKQNVGRQQEFIYGGAFDPRSNRLLPNPKHGPTVAGIEQLKAWAVVEDGDK
jgi:hypothetical protein